MLGASQANAFSSELDGLLNLLRSIGVGADTQLTKLVSPAHELHELLVSRRPLGSSLILNKSLDNLGR